MSFYIHLTYTVSKNGWLKVMIVCSSKLDRVLSNLVRKYNYSFKIHLWIIPKYLEILIVLDPGLPEGSLVIALVRPLVRPSVGLSLNISETALGIFLKFCMKLGHHKGTKVTEPDFWKKIWGRGLQIWETLHIWEIFDLLCPYLCIQSLTFSKL